jgi:hypothetical protein
MMKGSVRAAVLAAVLASAIPTLDAHAQTDNVDQLTASGYLAECQSDPQQCAKDADAADLSLTAQAIAEAAVKAAAETAQEAAPVNESSVDIYCEPEGATDETRRNVLVAYLRTHPEVGSQPLLEEAKAAFMAAWSGECATQRQADMAKVARLQQATVADYLSICRTSIGRCDSLTSDADDELVSRALRAQINDNLPAAFCFPHLPLSAIRTAMVGYLKGKDSLAATPLLNGWSAGFSSLWPNTDGQC